VSLKNSPLRPVSLLPQPVRGDAQNQDARSQPTGKPADKEVLKGCYVERMVEEKLAGQRKQTPRKTRPPRGGQGAGAMLVLLLANNASTAAKSMRMLVKSQPRSQKRNRAEKKALKAAAERGGADLCFVKIQGTTVIHTTAENGRVEVPEIFLHIPSVREKLTRHET
jgi:hypothetical protein